MALKDIKVRQINDEDYLEIAEWFKERKWKVPPGGKALPETGYVAELDGKLLSVAWLYITNSEIGIVDWIATSPRAGAKGIISLKKVLDHIEGVSEGAIRSFMHFTPNHKLAKYLHRKCGYKTVEKDVNICVRTRPEVAHG